MQLGVVDAAGSHGRYEKVKPSSGPNTFRVATRHHGRGGKNLKRQYCEVALVL